MKRVCFLLICFAVFPVLAFAQFDAATVVGTVRDTTGAVVAGAAITLTSLDTGLTAKTVTDDYGNYVFPSVRIGTYELKAEREGFTTASSGEIRLSVNTKQRVDLQLGVAQISTAVEVTGVAPLVETDSSQRGQVIGHIQAVELPLNGREYSSLTLLTSGVRASSIGTGSSLTPREGSFNVNGLRSTFNNFLLDGIDNNAYGTSNQGFSNQVMQPPPDAVAEFQVVTNNMSAEYGRSGGATINVAYASGTNQYHGSLWEFVRNTSLNAVGFFRPRVGNTLPFHRNQFGGVFGGPIVANRAFFFIDYEGYRQIRDLVTFSTIPTLAQRQGILPVTVTNPLTGKTYPAGTQIPQSDIQPFARKVLADLPLPTSGGTANNYQILQVFRNYTDKYDAKFDYSITPRMNGFARAGQRKANLFDQPPVPLPSGGGGNGSTRVLNQQLAFGLTYVPSAVQYLEFRFGVSRTRGGKSPAAVGTPNALDAYGIPGLPVDPRISGGLPTQLISGYSDLGRQATNPQWQYPTAYDPKLNYSLVRGRHTLKAGFEFQRIQTEVQDVNPLYGRDTYAGRFSGDNFGDFLFGLRSQYALSNIFIANLRQQMYFTYLQHDFHWTSKLTLNLGVRHEYATPHWEAENKLTNFDPAGRSMLTAKDGSIYNRALIHPDGNNWAPRIGFAYSAARNTVIRGGIGVSYIHFNRAGAANLLPINGPQVVNAVVNQTPAQSTFRNTQQGYPVGLASPQTFDALQANITYMPADTRTSYLTSWFFSIQRQLSNSMLVDLAYVGNRSNKLMVFANANQAVPNLPGQNLPLQQRRPIPNFSDITIAFNGGVSNYNSFQLRFERRFDKGLSILDSFTWSKAIDTAAGSLESPNGNFPAPQDFYNRKNDKGLSAYNQPLTNVTSLVYQLPVGRGQGFLNSISPLADAFVGGWQISFINTVSSGAAVTFTYQPSAALIVSGIQQDFRGANNYRPDIIGNPVLPKSQRSVTSYFNRDAVVIPAGPAPFGNAGRNTIRSDAFAQLDFAAAKKIALAHEGRTYLQFRAEIFNLLNKTNFLAPNANRTAGAFGTITATYDPRLVQLGVKVTF